MSGGYFRFLQQWIDDPSFGRITVTEDHVRKSKIYKKLEYVSMTKIDLYTMFRADTWPAGKAHADKLMKKAQKTRNPDFPNDSTMVLHRVLAKYADGKIESNEHSEGIFCFDAQHF
jgi:hypothetical protein